MRRILVLIAVILFGTALTAAVVAQGTDEKSSFITYVEEQLSTPNRQIRLNGLEGTLSSNVSMASITIADQEGVWLEITKPQLVWTRSALFSGRLEIDSLTAQKVDYRRNPLPDDSLPSSQATPITIPEFPIAVNIGKIGVEEVAFGEEVFGLKSQAKVAGSIALDGGSLKSGLGIERLDGPGGKLDLLANYDGSSRNLKLDLLLSEPEDGIIANLLNIPSTPPVEVRIAGDAPLDELDIALSFDVDAKRILGGELKFRGSDEGLQLSANLRGPLSSILPAQSRDFFGEDSRLTADALFADGGGIIVRDARLVSGDLRLAANAATLPDGFLSALNLNFRLASQEGKRVVLPGSGGKSSLAEAGLVVRYDIERRDEWDAMLIAKDVRTDALGIADVSFGAEGVVANAGNPVNRYFTFELDGSASGFTSDNPGLTEALGSRISLDGSGAYNTASALVLQKLAIAGSAFRAEITGESSDGGFDGTYLLESGNLSAFSALTGNNLAGSTKLSATGLIFPLSGGFDLKLDGTAQDLALGNPADPLFAGETELNGVVARTEEGTRFGDFRLFSDQLSVVVDGSVSPDKANLIADAEIRDLSSISEDASGRAKLVAGISGTQRPFAINSSITLPSGKLAKRDVRDLVLSFNGQLAKNLLTGIIGGDGFIGGERVSINAGIEAGKGAAGLENLRAEIGGTKLSGSVTRSAKGLLDGDLEISSRDVGAAAALLFVDATGQVFGKIGLKSQNAAQTVDANLEISKLKYGDIGIGLADVTAKVSDAFGTVPVIDIEGDAAGIVFGGTTVRTATAVAKTSGNKTDFQINAAIAEYSTAISSQGSVETASGQSTIALANLQLTSEITNARLAAPAIIVIRDGTASLDGFDLAVGGGSIRISGTAGETNDLAIRIASLPLAIANSFSPQTGAAGTIDGSIDLSGRASNPVADFSIEGSGVSVRQLSDFGLAPLTIKARGRFASNTVTLESLQSSNSDGLSISGSGRLPLSGGGLNLSINGNAPLTLAERYLVTRGATVSGQANFDISLTGALSDPRANGLLSVSGGTLSDPLTNLRLEEIGLIAGLNGETIAINRFNARLAGGGTITGNGTVGISGGFPADIRIALAGARYSDGETFSTTLDGILAVTGNLTADPLLSGTLNLGPTEIQVPESFASDANLLKVKHVSPDAATAQTLKRLEKVTPVPTPSSRPSVVRLDVAINAPNQIFVRGRGLDAELGGTLRATGPVTNIVPLGRFELRRGRLVILGQRLDLTQGSITLTGDLDPLLDFIATTSAGESDASIRLRGRASNLEVTFSSAQGLPDDEVLAAIVFGRRISELSPVQIAKLASIAAELTGGSNVSLVEQLRRGTGLDDLDVVEDDEGNTAVRAGKYVQDNVYLGIEAGKETEATINLDLTDDLTARGAVNSKGETSIGIFFEKDY